MKINFQNQEVGSQVMMTPEKKINDFGKEHSRSAAGMGGVNLSLGQSFHNYAAFDGKGIGAFGRSMTAGKTMEEIQAEIGAMDLGVSLDYKTVLSNTLSEEDYAKACEEGFHYSSMDPEDVVTIQDKVKAAVAQGGTQVLGFNDDLDPAVLAKAVGSETLARSLADAFSAANLPLTDENVNASKEAWDLLNQLKTPEEGAVSYLIENGLSTTVWNLYLSENSGAAENGSSFSRGPQQDFYYAQEVKGYFAKSETEVSSKELLKDAGFAKQVEGIAARAGLDADEGLKKTAWLLERNLPVTEESFRSMKQVEELSLPASEDVFAKAAAAAVSRGLSPMQADLRETKDLYAKAAELYHTYMSPEIERTMSSLSARRQLEEIRLSMTAEVNVKLLRSDFSIDTKPMEDLIGAIKKAEVQVAQQYFPQKEAEEAVSDYRLMTQVNRAVEETAVSPAAVLGQYAIKDVSQAVLGDFHREAALLRDTYVKAGDSYEALMTSPRADLGDSYRKAFANVESLTRELGMEPSSENQKAVRILGYNHMEITEENVLRIREADAVVTGVISEMKPANVLRMIRDGVNPLNESFESLQDYLRSIEEEDSYQKESDDYREYLYALDHKDGIRAEEREAYIGIYRMIHQVEKMDGAAVGAVVDSGMELRFSNLLSAVRTRRAGQMDVKVSDSFGGLDELVREGKTITQQIMAGFAGEDAQRQARQKEVEQMREAANVSKQTAELVKQAHMVESADNLLAMERLTSEDYSVFEQLDKYLQKKENSGKQAVFTKPENSPFSHPDRFDEEYADRMEDLKAQVEELTLQQDTELDVRNLRLLHKSLGLASALAKSEEDTQDFFLPMYIGDVLTKVHVSFRDTEGDSEKKTMDIYSSLPDGTGVEAHFGMQGDTFRGYLVGNGAEEVQKLNRLVDIFVSKAGEEENLPTVEAQNFPVISRQSNVSMEARKADTDGADRMTFIRIAKTFLESMAEV